MKCFQDRIRASEDGHITTMEEEFSVTIHVQNPAYEFHFVEVPYYDSVSKFEVFYETINNPDNVFPLSTGVSVLQALSHIIVVY